MAPHRQGKALTIALGGTPVALALGTPAATFIALLIGWRWTFSVTALLSGLVIIWEHTAAPAFPGQAKARRTPVGRVFRMLSCRDGGDPMEQSLQSRAQGDDTVWNGLRLCETSYSITSALCTRSMRP